MTSLLIAHYYGSICQLALLKREKRMFPSETAILMDIARNKDSGKQLANQAMDIVSEYIGYLCDSLVRRGYITGNRTKGYQLTSVGRGTLLEFLREELCLNK